MPCLDKNMDNAIVHPKDCEDYAKLIIKDTEDGQGEMSIENIKKVLGPANLFFKEPAVSENKKILVTEEEHDKWLGAHYGLTADNVPLLKPNHIPKGIYDRLKK